MPSESSSLNVRAFGLAAGIVAATLSAICGVALLLAPDSTWTLAGYLLHADLSMVAPVVSWGGLVVSVLGWGLIASGAFAAAAALYNRYVAPER